MIFGIGTDLIETRRIHKLISEDPDSKEQIFTQDEIKYCESMRYKQQYYAARFAAKEAFFKALGTGQRDGLAFSDVEIIKDELDKPEIRLHGQARAFCEENGITKIHVSLTHIKEFANAMVVLETLQGDTICQT